MWYLSYFIFGRRLITVLCAERLTQMTRTYDDSDALTRLLEEKERDLELAAHIGKSLLDEKRTLQVASARHCVFEPQKSSLYMMQMELNMIEHSLEFCAPDCFS